MLALTDNNTAQAASSRHPQQENVRFSLTAGLLRKGRADGCVVAGGVNPLADVPQVLRHAIAQREGVRSNLLGAVHVLLEEQASLVLRPVGSVTTTPLD
jgi:hypothetical protein